MLIEQDSAFYIVGIARNGYEALEKLQRFEPDVITMDVEMPELSGLEALARLMRERPTPVVMLSSQTGSDTRSTVRALELGAVDFFLKEDLIKDSLDAGVLADFHARMKTAAEARFTTNAPLLTVNEASFAYSKKGKAPAYDLLVIGCSTGGPSALQTILPRFPADYPASIIVVQHMPPGFTKPLAERFDNMCQLRVKEAEDGDLLLPGKIYISPSGYQTTARVRSDGRVALQVSEEPLMLYRPSVDVTLQSLAAIYRERLLSVVLTGMGHDGLEGCRVVKEHGGIVLTEAEESCIVYGMPKAVYDAGLADQQAVLSRMFSCIMSFI